MEILNDNKNLFKSPSNLFTKKLENKKSRSSRNASRASEDLIFTKGLFNDALLSRDLGMPKPNKAHDECFSRASIMKRAKSSSTVKSSRHSFAQSGDNQLLREKIDFFLQEKEKEKQNLYKSFVDARQSGCEKLPVIKKAQVDQNYFFDSKRNKPFDAGRSLCSSSLSKFTAASSASERTNINDVLDNLKSHRRSATRKYAYDSARPFTGVNKQTDDMGFFTSKSVSDMSSRCLSAVSEKNIEPQFHSFYSNSWRIHSEFFKNGYKPEHNPRNYDAQGNNKSTFFTLCTRNKLPETFLFDPQWI